MIPTIGLMIGMYIFARMVELLGLKDRGVVTKIFAVVTMLVALVSMADLLLSGNSTSSGLTP